jgi:DNA-binding PucR family transcriptional regulator
MKTAKTVYVIWGPDATWGDGVGVIGYALSLRDAKACLRDEQRTEREYGPASWRSVNDCGDIEEVPAVSLGWDETEDLERFVSRLTDALR